MSDDLTTVRIDEPVLTGMYMGFGFMIASALVGGIGFLLFVIVGAILAS